MGGGDGVDTECRQSSLSIGPLPPYPAFSALDIHILQLAATPMCPYHSSRYPVPLREEIWRPGDAGGKIRYLVDCI